MTNTIEALLERDSIKQVLTAYANALDSFQAERLLTEVFSPAATVDYSAAGGIQGSPQDLVNWLGEAMSKFDTWQHLLSNFVIDIDGNTASARTECFNPLQNSDATVLVGCCYHDKLCKTDGQWRISERRLSLSWMKELS